MKFRLCAFALMFSASLFAQDLTRVPAAHVQEATSLFKIYRGSPDAAVRAKAVDDLIKLDVMAMLALVPVLEHDWQTAITAFQTTELRLATEVARKRQADPAFAKEVRTLRETLAKLRSGKELPTKDQLHGEGEKALKRLRELHKISVADLNAALPTLGALRENALAMTRMRTALKLKTALKNNVDFSEDDVKRMEASALAGAFQNNQAATKILEANAAMAAKKLVPEEEADGVRDLNEMRMLAGLAPCLIDPKLHEAARGHSKDMATLDFFDHDSPVAKKKTFTDRARLAGTSAEAENISRGHRDPQGANEGWFFSPGHHVNMFGNHRRVGMGGEQGYWTQMFGG